MTARLGTAVAAVLLALASGTAAGQQVDSTRLRADSAERPFVRGGVFDKPFLTTLAGRTAIGGYAEAHARWSRVDGAAGESGFSARRFNLFTNTRVSDLVRIGAELEFEDGASEIALEYAAIDVRVHPALTMRAGMILSPLGRFNLSHDSPLNEFTDRPQVSTELLGVALSEPGFGVLGQVRAGAGARVTYEVYATNGFHDGLVRDAADGTRIPLGRGNVEDNNGSPALVGRLAVSPSSGYELGLSAHRGAWNSFVIDGLVVDDRRDLVITVIDAEARIGPVVVSGEAASARVDLPPGLTALYAGHQRGGYLDAVLPVRNRMVPALRVASLALKARLDYVDFDSRRTGQSRAQLTVGLNARPTGDSVLKLDYVRGRWRDEFNNASSRASLLFSVATYF